MQIAKSLLTTEVKSAHLKAIIHCYLQCAVRRCITPKPLPAELNQASMKLWEDYPDLAVFPGTVLLNDDRPDRDEYPSSPLDAAQLKQEEPGLSDTACKAGARLYSQEGMPTAMSLCW